MEGPLSPHTVSVIVTVTYVLCALAWIFSVIRRNESITTVIISVGWLAFSVWSPVATILLGCVLWIWNQVRPSPTSKLAFTSWLAFAVGGVIGAIIGSLVLGLLRITNLAI